jgi:hypothetical protein
MTQNNEMSVEVNYTRRFNLGNFNHKEYVIKLAGTEAQIESQFQERKEKLQTYLEQLETIVDLAHEANILKAKMPKEVTPETPQAA